MLHKYLDKKILKSFNANSGDTLYQILYGTLFVLTCVLFALSLLLIVKIQSKLCKQKTIKKEVFIQQKPEYIGGQVKMVDTNVVRDTEVCVKKGNIDDASYHIKLGYYIGWLFTIIFGSVAFLLILPFIMQGIGNMLFLLLGFILYKSNIVAIISSVL